MKKPPFLTWVIVLIALLPAGYLAIIWKNLPLAVPVHFGLDMKPDRIGNKEELLLSTGVLSLVTIGIYFLLTNLHRVDPKRKGAGPSTTFSRLAAGLVVFLSALNLIIILSAKGTTALQNLLFPLIGLLFALIGNYMHSIRPNYFAGIRLPWTLSSDENWRRTHYLAGKLWFVGGLLIVIASLFLPLPVMLGVFIGIVLVTTIIPAIYSYRLFKQHI